MFAKEITSNINSDFSKSLISTCVSPLHTFESQSPYIIQLSISFASLFCEVA